MSSSCASATCRYPCPASRRPVSCRHSARRRGGAREHEALDILAPRGTAAIAVEEGRVEKLFTSERGGLTVYLFDPSRTYCYYAHLDRYADDLKEETSSPRGHRGPSGRRGMRRRRRRTCISPCSSWDPRNAGGKDADRSVCDLAVSAKSSPRRWSRRGDRQVAPQFGAGSR